jgi:hypothetical protein
MGRREFRAVVGEDSQMKWSVVVVMVVCRTGVGSRSVIRELGAVEQVRWIDRFWVARGLRGGIEKLEPYWRSVRRGDRAGPPDLFRG